MKYFYFYFLFAIYAIAENKAPLKNDLGKSVVGAIAQFNVSESSNKSCVKHRPQSLFRIQTREEKFKSDFCNTLNDLSRSIAGVQDEKNICSYVWEVNRAISDINNLSERSKDRPKSSFRPPSRRNILSWGFSIASDLQNQELIDQIAKNIKPVSGLCCQNDSECEEAMSKVGIKVCRDAEADKNIDLADSCSPTNLPRYEIIDSSAMILEIKKNKKITAGNILISPFFKENDIKTINNVVHELGHACSSIRRQLLILRTDSSAVVSTFSKIEKVEQAIKSQQSTTELCALDDSFFEGYKSIFKSMTGSDEFSNCVFKMLQASADKKSKTYINNICLTSQVEESAAEALNLIYLVRNNQSYPDLFPIAICGTRSSFLHPHNSELAKCLFQNMNELNAKVRSALTCDCR